MNWRLKRQLIAIGIFGLLIAIVVFGLFFFFQAPVDERSAPSFDGVKAPQPVRLMWARFFPVRTGVYDAAALVENPNNNRKAAAIRYIFRLFDEDNILIAAKEGISFLNPAEQFIIFEPLVVTAVRTPKRISFETREVTWQTEEKRVLPITIKQKQVEKDTVRAVVANTGIAPLASLEAVAILLDSAGNAIAVARSIIEAIAAGEEREIVFTWPRQLPEPTTIQIYVRKN